MKSGLLTKARILSGVVMYVFVTTHLANHALGLISVNTMEEGRVIFTAVWRNPIGTFVLYGSLLVHFALILGSLAQRRTLRMPIYEVLQVIFGLLFPIVLIIHVIGTRISHEIYGIEDSYRYALAVFWTIEPKQGVLQATMLTLAWLHGTIGIYLWLRLQNWFNRWVATSYTFVVILPILALMGFVNGGRTVAIELANRNYVPPKFSSSEIEFLYSLIYLAIAIYVTLIGFAFLWRLGRWIYQKRMHMVRITYPNGQQVTVEPGTSVLDASRRAQIPHASVCGGRGRCSTCRIHVSYGQEHLPQATQEESRVLRRVGLAGSTRLACQLRPTQDISITPLLPADTTARDLKRQSLSHQGTEKDIVILFADIRDFTSIAEQKLPYDVVFVLNQYFHAVGQAIEGAGGHIDKFIGDGVMALFGIENEVEKACVEALTAAQHMAKGIEELNHRLKYDLEKPLRIGIGIHVGSVIVGDMGYAGTRSITAIGDAVNTASRLEGLNKRFHSQLLVSDQVVTMSGSKLNEFRSEQVDIDGRKGGLTVYVIPDAAALPHS